MKAPTPVPPRNAYEYGQRKRQMTGTGREASHRQNPAPKRAHFSLRSLRAPNRFLLAMRDIAADEELRFDHSISAADGDVRVCECKEPGLLIVAL